MAENHPALSLSIAKARRRGWETFSDNEYAHVLQVVADRFPGLEVIQLRPLPNLSCSILTFVWDAELLVKHGILEPTDFPQPPKRKVYLGDRRTGLEIVDVSRIRGGRIKVSARIADDIGPIHALAFFRPPRPPMHERCVGRWQRQVRWAVRGNVIWPDWRRIRSE